MPRSLAQACKRSNFVLVIRMVVILPLFSDERIRKDKRGAHFLREREHLHMRKQFLNLLAGQASGPDPKGISRSCRDAELGGSGKGLALRQSSRDSGEQAIPAADRTECGNSRCGPAKGLTLRRDADGPQAA